MTATPPSAYPTPDRSDQVRSLTKDVDGIIDIGWCDGLMTDGRPFSAEMWAQNGVSMLTLFFSNRGIEELQSQDLRELVVKEELVAFRSEAVTFCEGRGHTDCAGNTLWSVNVVVGDDDGSFLTGSVPIVSYPRTERGHEDK